MLRKAHTLCITIVATTEEAIHINQLPEVSQQLAAAWWKRVCNRLTNWRPIQPCPQIPKDIDGGLGRHFMTDVEESNLGAFLRFVGQRSGPRLFR